MDAARLYWAVQPNYSFAWRYVLAEQDRSRSIPAIFRLIPEMACRRNCHRSESKGESFRTLREMGLGNFSEPDYAPADLHWRDEGGDGAMKSSDLGDSTAGVGIAVLSLIDSGSLRGCGHPIRDCTFWRARAATIADTAEGVGGDEGEPSPALAK